MLVDFPLASCQTTFWPSPPGYLSSWKKFLNCQRQKGVHPKRTATQMYSDDYIRLHPHCNPFTHRFTTHTAGTSSPTRPVLSPLQVSPPQPLTHPSRPTFAHSQHTHTPLPGLLGHQLASIVCSFSGRRGGRGPGWGSGRADVLGAEHPGRRLGLGEVAGGTKQCAGAPPNPAGARGPRVHLSSHYCNKSGLHYMKGKMNYRR